MTLLVIWQGDCPRVMDWYQRIAPRPSFTRVLAELDRLKSHELMQDHGRPARAKLQSLIG